MLLILCSFKDLILRMQKGLQVCSSTKLLCDIVSYSLSYFGYKFDPTGADLGGGCRGCGLPPPEMTWLLFVFSIKIFLRLVTSQLRHSLVVQPLLKKNPGSAPVQISTCNESYLRVHSHFMTSKNEMIYIISLME